LLDDGASTPPPPSTTTAPENKTAPTDESRASSKTNDCKAPPANDGTTAKKTDETPGDSNGGENAPSDGIKATLSAGVTEDTSFTEEGKPVADRKPTIATHPEDPTTVGSAGTGQTTTTADAFAGPVPSPAPSVTPSPDQTGPKEPQGDTSLAVDAAPQLSALAPTPPKIATGKQTSPANQPDAEQPVETAQTSSETVGDPQPAIKNAQPHSGKSQLVANENDRSPAQGRVEVPADGQSKVDTATIGSGDAGTASPKVTMDMGTQPPTITSAEHGSNEATALASPSGSQPAAIPMAGLAIEIAGKAFAGKNRFEIRLDPPELGRIEVRLDVDRDGNVTSRLTVERGRYVRPAAARRCWPRARLAGRRPEDRRQRVAVLVARSIGKPATG
jgi:flagellar hook-length control protein FliK